MVKTNTPAQEALQEKAIIPSITIAVDESKFMIPDLALIDRMKRERDLKKAGKTVLDPAPLSDLIELLDRVIVGGVRSIPAKHFKQVMEALMESLTAMMQDVTGGADPEKN